MINGAHSIIYSKDPEADRTFFRDVLKFPSCDAGDGWLIFGLPPAEAAFHPAEENNRHEFYLMSDDINAFTGMMKVHGISCSDHPPRRRIPRSLPAAPQQAGPALNKPETSTRTNPGAPCLLT